MCEVDVYSVMCLTDEIRCLEKFSTAIKLFSEVREKEKKHLDDLSRKISELKVRRADVAIKLTVLAFRNIKAASWLRCFILNYVFCMSPNDAAKKLKLTVKYIRNSIIDSAKQFYDVNYAHEPITLELSAKNILAFKKRKHCIDVMKEYAPLIVEYFDCRYRLSDLAECISEIEKDFEEKKLALKKIVEKRVKEIAAQKSRAAYSVDVIIDSIIEIYTGQAEPIKSSRKKRIPRGTLYTWKQQIISS